MHQELENVCSELDQLARQIPQVIASDEPFNIAHNNWTFPGVTRTDLVRQAESLSTLIRERADDLVATEQDLQRVSDYVRRLKYLGTHTVPQIWGNSAAAVPPILVTLQALRQDIQSLLRQEDSQALRDRLKQLTTRVRAMEARAADLEPRTEKLGDAVSHIELVREAAEKFPTDIHELQEARERVTRLLSGAQEDTARLSNIRSVAEQLEFSLKTNAQEAAKVLVQCETAYAAATSQGLAAAFYERSTALDRSMWAWVGGLIVALLLGGWVGSARLQSLSQLVLQPEASGGLVALNLLLSLLSVGAPIWFAWLATKQIGQRFRLAEDYAFKASVSRAYEGYRREAVRMGGNMEENLLASALTRLDELPLRLVETTSHGSPWQEFLSSDALRDAVKTIPGFASHLTEFAQRSVAQWKAQKSGTANAMNASNVEPITAASHQGASSETKAG